MRGNARRLIDRPNNIYRKKPMKLTKEEKEIEALHQGNALTLKKPDQALLKQLRRAAENTFKKDRRINIRLSDHDIVGIQRVAAAKGVPYQPFISGLIHQYVEGDLLENREI